MADESFDIEVKKFKVKIDNKYGQSQHDVGHWDSSMSKNVLENNTDNIWHQEKLINFLHYEHLIFSNEKMHRYTSFYIF